MVWGSNFSNGGEGGIRTLEPLLTVTRFPIVRARPGYATSPDGLLRFNSPFIIFDFVFLVKIFSARIPQDFTDKMAVIFFQKYNKNKEKQLTFLCADAIISKHEIYARVVELADSLASGASALHGRAGSSPASRTNKKRCNLNDYGVIFMLKSSSLPFNLPFTGLQYHLWYSPFALHCPFSFCL